MPGHRCVLGCKQTGSALHCFPNPDKFPERFKVWVEIAGGRLETPSDFEYYKKKKMCDIHFKVEHKNRNKRLNALAVPCLYLPGRSAPHSEMDSLAPSSTSARDITTGRSAPHSEMETLDPSSSTASTAATTGDLITPHSEAVNQPDPSYTSLNATDASNISSVLAEHNYSMLSRCERKKATKVATMGCQAQAYKKKIKSLQANLCRLRKKSDFFRQRLANAKKLSDDIHFRRLIKGMKKPAQLFINMQKQEKFKAKGRRFTNEEKILCLSLYKKSPNCYRLLAKYFTLPSTKAMTRLLSRIKIKEGINSVIFDKIRHGLRDHEVSDRLCTLIFDEMSITPQIFYNAASDKFSGFAYNQESSFADHALVFMVKGVKRNFKQPVAYYFTSGLKKNDLKVLIKTVIRELMKAGLIVIATICDQSAVNVGAITDLVNETKATYLRQNKQWRESFFTVCGKKIIPVYDPPHLIKGIRNNLLSKDLAYTSNGERKVVKWEYFENVYNADKAHGELRLLHKVTEEHINKEKINKMRVKSATQLFSHSFAVVTNHLVARGEVPEECRQLIDLTLLLDNVFDSLNGSSYNVPNGKIFKGPVKKTSPHHKLWQNAKQIFKSMKFIKIKKSGNKVLLTESVAPSVKNFIKTIEGMESICKILNEKYRIDAVLTRNLNQDPVENFFGSIRSYGARNIAPNTVAFEGAFKALMVNNMKTLHSNRANCEKDGNECLQNLDFYLKEKIDDTPDTSKNYTINFEKDVCLGHENENDAGQSNYVCGWVLRKCLKNIVKRCENCRLTLLENQINVNNVYITAKEYYNKKWLCYPSEDLEKYFKAIQNITVSILKKDVPKSNVKNSILLYQDLIVESPFKCNIHKDELKKYFLNLVINVILYSWTRSVNRILCGKLTYDGEDEIKNSAQAYYNKYKHYKNRK